MHRSAISRALNSFERAVENKAFQGQYPRHSDDQDEQEQLDAIHFTIEHNYIKARSKLERLLENA